MSKTCDPRRWVMCLALMGSVTCWGLPQRLAADEPTKKADASEKKADDEKEEKPDFPPFDEVSEDHEKKAGFFDLYYDKTKDHLLAVIPKSMVGKNFLVASSIAGGSPYTGFTLDTDVVQWREMGKKLVLIEPDTSNARSEDSTVSDVIARTYTDRIVLSTGRNRTALLGAGRFGLEEPLHLAVKLRHDRLGGAPADLRKRSQHFNVLAGDRLGDGVTR